MWVPELGLFLLFLPNISKLLLDDENLFFFLAYAAAAMARPRTHKTYPELNIYNNTVLGGRARSYSYSKLGLNMCYARWGK